MVTEITYAMATAKGAKSFVIWSTGALVAVVALAGCQGDELAAIPPLGNVDGYVCHPVLDELAPGVTVEGPTLRDEVVSTVTDLSGYFYLEDVLAGPQPRVLTVTGPDFTSTIEVPYVVANALTRAPDPSCLDAGMGVVTGRICATEQGLIGSGEGYWLANAYVYINAGDTTYEAHTDADGYFTMSVRVGTHTLMVDKGSFHAETQIVVLQGETTTLAYVCFEPTTQIAVVTGMFDSVETILVDLGFTIRDCIPAGFSKCPANLDPDGSITLVEGESTAYLTDLLDDWLLLNEYEIVFFNCGLTDQHIFNPPPSISTNLQGFVNGGGSIYVSDRAYEILRVIFPGTFDFVGDESSWGSDRDSGWVGVLDNFLSADITDSTLADVVGTSTVNLVYDKGGWVPLNPSQPGSVVSWMTGDVAIEGSPDVSDQTLNDAPLLASVPYGAGRIVFTTFHNSENVSAEMTAILRYIVFEL